MLKEAPSFFGKHLNYFKDKYPGYFTEMALPEEVSPNLVSKAHNSMIELLRGLFKSFNLK
jgi:hypothetical protein